MAKNLWATHSAPRLRYSRMMPVLQLLGGESGLNPDDAKKAVDLIRLPFYPSLPLTPTLFFSPATSVFFSRARILSAREKWHAERARQVLH